MKGENGIRAVTLTRKGARIINRDVVVFAFFLILSFFFWYLNFLGKEIEAGIKFQVRYINLPKERVIEDDSPDGLNLFLKGTGYSVLKLRVSGRKMPVIIDISKVNFKRIPGTRAMNYYIITSSLTKSLNVQMRSGCEITSIKPDTLFFTLTKVVANPSVISVNKDENKKK